MRHLKNLFVFLLTLVLVSSVASALPVTIDKFELDDVELTPDSAVSLDLDRGTEYPVRIKFTPEENLTNVEFTLFISGYEYSHYQKIADSTRTEDYSAGVTYTERMTLELPSDLDEDEYKLRLILTDKDSNSSEFNYNIKVDTEKHKLVIEDIVMSPAGQVESGKALYLNARVGNEGRKSEKDVKVVFSIPELGIKTAGYIEEIEAGEEEEIEDGVVLLLPDCAEEKEYTVEAAAIYDNKHKEAVVEDKLWIVENARCNVQEVAAPAAPVVAAPVEEPADTVEPASKVRSALEVALLVLVGLLVVIGLIIGFSKLGSKDEF